MTSEQLEGAEPHLRDTWEPVAVYMASIHTTAQSCGINMSVTVIFDAMDAALINDGIDEPLA